MATVMLRQCTVTNSLTKLLRQSQIRMVKFSTDSDDSEEAKRKLSSLLTSIKSNEKKTAHRDPRQAKPKSGNLPKRDSSGKIKASAENLKNSGVSEELIDAAREVSNLAKGSRKKIQTESALLKKLKSISADANSSRSANEVTGEKSTADFFSDFKVEKKPVSKVMTDRKAKIEQQKNLTMDQIAFLEKRARMRRQKSGASLEENYVPTDIFGGTPLGVFTKPVDPATAPDLTTLVTWRNCVNRELTLLSNPPPRNALEEHILWTEQGKLWQFPIDNEQGLDYSHEPFHKHVFLEQHLDPWCPPVGPVRHFMELVCLALSKNPYVSVDYKLKTIEWFKNFFEEPEINEILVHQGAWEDKQIQQ